MKKKLLLLVTMLLPMAAWAYDAEIDGIYYNFEGTEAMVISASNQYTTSEIVIPEIVIYNETEYSVTSIGNNAFYGFSSLTSITIPNSVKTIGEGAFYYCSALASIAIPNSVTSISWCAFAACSSLTSITIPNSVTTIGAYAFSGCSGLTSITIPNSVTSIGESPFSGCNLASIIVEEGNSVYDSRNNCNAIIETSTNTLISGCKNTTIPNSVTHIGSGAFSGSGLTSITIPNSVTTIKASAFLGCSDLTSITIPNSVTVIEQDAFGNCSSLTSVMIPKSVTRIDSNPFRNCNNIAAITIEEGNSNYDSRNNCNAIIETSSNTLISGCKNTTIPNSVTEIDCWAFCGCSGLTSITIPNSVTIIEFGAFQGCSGLTSITIPNSVTHIGVGDTFRDCSNLITVSIGNSVTTIGQYAFSGCSSLSSITIPSSVTTILKAAFAGCSSLSSITIPSSVTTIGESSFYGCNNITDIYCFAESVPTTDANVFGGSTPISNITLHVPASSVDAYKAAEPWSGFGEIVALSTIDVSNQKIGLDGTTTVEIGLNNSETNFVAFQMDLTLPEGVSIDKTGCSLSSRITDENQELTVGKLESGDYRITSTSLSLTPISGNEGTLLTLKLTAEEDYEGGQATISNIRFSTSNSVKVVMSDETFDIDILKKYKLRYIVDGEEYSSEEVKETTPLTPADEPTREGYTFGGWSEVPETMPDHDVVITGRFYLFGDVNTDEEVDVVDVVDIARFVVATPSANFREKLADLNKDLTVNIADAVVLVNHIAGDQDFAMAPSIGSYDYNQCKLQLLSNGTNTLSLCLSGDADFTAFQFDMELPENSKITTIKINGQRMSGHQLLYNKVGDNCYRVAVLSLSNAVFKGREGELLNISIDGLATDEISIHDIHFVTKTAIDFTFEDISHCETVTSIDHVQLDEGNSVIFDLQGRKLSKAQRGVNIIRSVGGRMQGKKVFVNK